MTRDRDNPRLLWRARFGSAAAVLMLLAPAVLLSACCDVFYIENWGDCFRGEVIYERPWRGQPVVVQKPEPRPVLARRVDLGEMAPTPPPYDPDELLKTYSWPKSRTVVRYNVEPIYSRILYGSRYLYGRQRHHFHPHSGSMGFIIARPDGINAPRTRTRMPAGKRARPKSQHRGDHHVLRRPGARPPVKKTGVILGTPARGKAPTTSATPKPKPKRTSIPPDDDARRPQRVKRGGR